MAHSTESGGADCGFIPDPNSEDALFQQYCRGLSALAQEVSSDNPHTRRVASLEQYIEQKFELLAQSTTESTQKQQ